MAVKKSQLYSSIWKSCDELRGSMDASQYKDYILVILFVKYVTDKYYGKKDSIVEVPKGASFHDMIELKGQRNIGEGINKIVSSLTEANDLGNLTKDADFDDSAKLGTGKAKVDRLTSIIGIFQNDGLDFSKNKAEGDDIIGDAYEYLMRNFATQSGKSKGQFYTPAEVSRIIAKVIGTANAKTKNKTVYDPTCGSGSLLLKAQDESPNGLTIYGQEKDLATSSMAKMNMFIHNAPLAVIKNEDTISSPQFIENEKLKTFDFAVANPPFSDKVWGKGLNKKDDPYQRFDGFAIPPNKNGDYAYLLHMLKSLKPDGKGAIVLPHGVLFRGNIEAVIRKNIIERGWIKGIIGLAPNLFYGTGIPACIIILDKENAQARKGIFMIDASESFVKEGNKNRLQAKDIHKIVDAFTKQLEIPKFSRLVPHSEIADEKNDYNLNITRYIDSQEKEDIQDIDGHLRGGIPETDIDDLDRYWKEYPSLRKLLFSKLRDGYLKINVDKPEIKNTIFDHSEFKKYLEKMNKVFDSWKSGNLTHLEKLKVGSKPKELIPIISEDVLQKYSKFVLIDKYDVYQKLMTYWEDTMQDDAYLISVSGWDVSLVDIKDKKEKVKGWDSELIPKDIVISKYFSKQRDELESFQTELDSISEEKQSMDEEQSESEGDLFSEVRGAKSIPKNNIKKRIKEIKNDPDFSDELELLTKYLKLLEKETEVKAKSKTATEKFEKGLLAKYKSLKESEIKEMVIHDKWLASIYGSINEELETISQSLAGRIKDLTERYETPLPNLSNDVKELSGTVNQHLEKMGFKW